MIDHVRYAVPFGALAHWLLVDRDVRAIFEYRADRLAERFGVRAASRKE